MIDRDAADPAEPRLQVADRDPHVRADARSGDRAVRDREEEGGRDDRIVRKPGDLVGPGHGSIEDLLGHGNEGGVSDPGAVVAEPNLAFLVGDDVGEGARIRCRVAADGYHSNQHHGEHFDEHHKQLQED